VATNAMAQQAAALQLLTVGQLLFGDDLDATCHTLLPGSKVGGGFERSAAAASAHSMRAVLSMCARRHMRVTMV
jgi:hypothetical protein